MEIKLEIGYEIINSYKRLAYKPWFALAEYIDNSTQAYKNNKTELDIALALKGEKLKVEVSIAKSGADEIIEIKDNSMGMSFNELKDAVIIGKPPVNINGRSKYGLGMKTASFWLGNEWSVITKKLNETQEHTITVSIEKVSNNNGELDYSVKENVEADLHYTKIRISRLNHTFSVRTKERIKDYLRSIYRYDIINADLELSWQGENLEWDYQKTFEKLIPLADGQTRKNVEFKIGEKNVRGWAGVLETGSRSKAGFSILQHNRVIIGWPDSYRPESIFGPQKGGSNDLVNQRFVGELFLDDFRVSHTKDEIIFEGEEEDLLDYELGVQFGDLRAVAKLPKKVDVLTIHPNEKEFQNAIASFEREFSSPQLVDTFNVIELPENDLIAENNKVLVENIVKSSNAVFEVQLGALLVKVYIEEDVSFNDPYLSISIHSVENKLDILINKNHPHWKSLESEETILNYIRHCVYDGVAEWKAYKITGVIEPDTVKLIKDNLLRASFKFLNS